MLSRVEDAILASINGVKYTAEPMSRIEELLKELNQVIIDSGIDEDEVIEILETKVTEALNTTDKTVIGAINELLTLIGQVPKFGVKVVDELPTELISTSTLYFLRAEKATTGNMFSEWIYIVDDETGVGTWEKLGEQVEAAPDVGLVLNENGEICVTVEEE